MHPKSVGAPERLRYPRSVQILYQYPDAHGRTGDMLAAGRVTTIARAVERAGLHGLSFTEHPAPGARWLDAGGHQTLDPFIALGHAAAVTERIRLLTYLSVLPYRNPFLLGKAAATLDLLSEGRFTLGLGVGYQRGEFRALGVDFDERNDLFDEALDVLPRFWSGEPLSFTGRHFEARDVICLPRPRQQPIPIWIGGNARVTVQRVAERAQGWMPMLSNETVSTTTRTAHIGDIATLAQRVGELRDMAPNRAQGQLGLDVLVTYPDVGINDPASSVEHHRDILGQLAAAGVTWVGIPGNSTSEIQTLESIEFIARTILSLPGQV